VRFHKLCVLGLGYIGLPTASTFATHGLRVVGVDVNPQVVETLRNGGLHIHEPGLRVLVQAAVASGNLVISDRPEEADAFIIAVPTPFYVDHLSAANPGEPQQPDVRHADLRAVISAAEAVAPFLRPGNLVILESTSPPRTTVDVVAPILERSGLKAGSGSNGDGFLLVHCPERVLPGHILRELIENDRVIGGIDLSSALAARDLYSSFVRGEIVLTDATTAEMVKLMENTYRDVNIALANEFSRLAERFGTDVWEAIALANRHPRVNLLNPGPGVGGHCIGVDPWFLVEAAPDITPLIHAARTVNDAQPEFVVDLIRRTCGSLEGNHLTVLGLSYKPDVDDLRESPAIKVAQTLARAGALVTTYDPLTPTATVPGCQPAETLEAALHSAECLILLVAHTSLKNLDARRVATQSSARIVVDAVNGWVASDWQAAGFHVARLGVGEQMLSRKNGA